MSFEVRIPRFFETATGGENPVVVERDASNIGEVILGLVEKHPNLIPKIFVGEGELHRHLAVFIDDEDIRFNKGLGSAILLGQTVQLLPAIAGGQ